MANGEQGQDEQDEHEEQNPEEQNECNYHCRKVWRCFFCKTLLRLLRFICTPFRAIYAISWPTWKDALIMISGVSLILGLTTYAVHLNNLNPPKELPEVLKYLLSGIVGYVFAYVPASKAITSTERDRGALLSFDAALQQVVTILQRQKEIYEGEIERHIERINELEAEDISDDDETQSGQGTPSS
ncbi:MAG: hypothetical protein A4E48_01966 [Methanosaeta sp. PtaU1.Bin060]|nr:MAG: hypothetical protein A4E48_01966 [Methanosaeta sp. PtaU1.Bin060]